MSLFGNALIRTGREVWHGFQTLAERGRLGKLAPDIEAWRRSLLPSL